MTIDLPIASMPEREFEAALVHHLQHIGGTKQWEYLPGIKTTEQLWDNFAAILYQLNRAVLDRPLSQTEFSQVKEVISSLATPYHAGQFLYGLNGISQVEIDTDDGRHVFLTVFDQRQVGAGNTRYQIVTQIERPAKMVGKQKRRFDTTLLINGLPLIQIEEKSDANDVDQGLNQMEQYIRENQYSDIFATVQILVALSPVDVRYMANTTGQLFNKAFAFKWQTETNERVSDWRQFADLFLSIPMAHRMATSYMILDGTRNRQQLKVMRPYQVYATRKVIKELENHDFHVSNKEQAKIGYVWHTTGSGKTITSFKTAWLASRLPNVDKVVFLVDRIALTSQTVDNYAAYDPDNDTATSGLGGVVRDTKHTGDLARKLKSRDSGIIVTSTQKLARLVSSRGFVDPGKSIVFVVDEAHRSTAGDTFARIQAAFARAAWVGYTGTPIFDDSNPGSGGKKTREIFGRPLHSYTIKNAIADKNVLGFRVEFKNTIPVEVLEPEFLPNHFRRLHPSWSEEQIRRAIERLTPEEVDDVTTRLYDMNTQHVSQVVINIMADWENRSVAGKYNALLTTHVGGGGPSSPMVMLYWQEFRVRNERRRDDGLRPLSVAATFSPDTSNSDSARITNSNLDEVIRDYNQQFGTSFGLDSVGAYTADVMERLKRTHVDGRFLDIVIVVDQLLTGFDAPQLNTLYVDRTFRSAGLIQAYSRTNRIFEGDKEFGTIVNFRLPTLNEQFMNDALGVYANEGSADVQGSLVEAGVLAGDFAEQLAKTHAVVEQIAELTGGFVDIPKSESEREKVMSLLRQYSSGITTLKQYPVQSDENGNKIPGSGFDYHRPEELTAALGMTGEQERTLTTVFAHELRVSQAKAQKVDLEHIDLRMAHIKEVKVNYDYLTELVAALMNAKHDQVVAEQANDQTRVEEAQRRIDKTAAQITLEAAAENNVHFIDKVARAVRAIIQGAFHLDERDYPVDASGVRHVIEAASQVTVDRELLDFRNKWGITDVMPAADLKNWLRNHVKGADDLNTTGRLAELCTQGASVYRQMAGDDTVRRLSPIKYRNALREAIRQLADSLVGKL